MQVRVFTVPMMCGEEENEAMNKWLKGNRVVEVDRRFCEVGGAGYWTFCITAAEGAPAPSAAATASSRREKVDYRNELEPAAFARFSAFRDIRKQISHEEAVQPFVVFTDAELAAIAKLETLDEAHIAGLQGIGPARAEKYGREMLRRFAEHQQLLQLQPSAPSQQAQPTPQPQL